MFSRAADRAVGCYIDDFEKVISNKQNSSVSQVKVHAESQDKSNQNYRRNQ